MERHMTSNRVQSYSSYWFGWAGGLAAFSLAGGAGFGAFWLAGFGASGFGAFWLAGGAGFGASGFGAFWLAGFGASGFGAFWLAGFGGAGMYSNSGSGAFSASSIAFSRRIFSSFSKSTIFFSQSCICLLNSSAVIPLFQNCHHFLGLSIGSLSSIPLSTNFIFRVSMYIFFILLYLLSRISFL